jgi:RHH-type proline utilization regulon transcriptional repressor/proline dehydrogenase/delta 1-pyrroline-5-carboxylate dehydrogenase
MVFWRRSDPTTPIRRIPELHRGLPPPADLEARIQSMGRNVLQAARNRRASRLSRQFWSDHLMQWAMKDEAFKAQLFRFVDVFPMLGSPERIHAHLQEYLSQPGIAVPAGLTIGLKAGSLFRRTVGSTVTSRVLAMANRFILAGDLQSALGPLRELRAQGMATSVDLLGEACVSDVEARAYQRRYLALVDTLARELPNWPPRATLDTDHLGPIPRANISVKISSLSARIKPADTEGSIERLIDVLQPILESAGRHNIFVNFDMEQHELKDLTIALFERCCERFDFPAGIALQAYLRSGEADAGRLIDWSRRTRRQITVRLIKGAYWDYEVIRADMMGWPCPVWSRKHETDACFERMAAMFLSQSPRAPEEPGVKLAIGSHNIRSIAAALALAEQHDLPPAALEFQMLHGMADELKAALIDRGLRLRVYAPVGEMIPGMAYLVRRLLENTSNESWLRAGFAEDAPPEMLLASPHQATAGDREQGTANRGQGTGDSQRTQGRGAGGEGRTAGDGRQGEIAGARPSAHGVEPGSQSTPPTSEPVARLAARRHRLSPAVEGLGDSQPFLNEPLRDFSIASVRARFAHAIGKATVPNVPIDATVQDAAAALRDAHRAFPAWRDTPARKRAAMLIKAAGIVRERRDDLSGLIIRESGKTWSEADADVCEAIDFAEYYARQAVALFDPARLGRFTGELNEHWHQPRGVAVIISPWNFPLSICTGMTTAALVTGNTAIVKPAEQTPAIAARMCEILWQAGVPRDVLHFLPGPGETVGAWLVRESRVAIVAFTGSKAVGLDILAAAGQTPANQPHVKHVVCEMGGKNAIIVDDSADLDEAVLAIRQSAFSFAGQKCSACSRAIVLDTVHDLFLHRLVESTRSLTVGDPMSPATDIGPVIDAEAARNIHRYIGIGMAEGKRELACVVPPGLEMLTGKPYIAPHIFSDIREHHRLAQDEIFGPVLSVMRAKTFDEALHIANSTTYRLTGGVFSRTPSHLELARREFRVGNLYLNRGITGALVGRQPFGGFGLSGTGTQAGGPEYLLHFVDSRICTENTLRRGFAPETNTAPGLAPAGE